MRLFQWRKVRLREHWRSVYVRRVRRMCATGLATAAGPREATVRVEADGVTSDAALTVLSAFPLHRPTTRVVDKTRFRA